jgi:hypothetical protein
VNKTEAGSLAAARLDELRKLPYAELKSFLDNSETRELVAPSGVTYQVETYAFWDDKNAGHLRVSVAVDDGGWRAFLPLGWDFIIAPDGSFVGE